MTPPETVGRNGVERNKDMIDRKPDPYAMPTGLYQVAHGMEVDGETIDNFDEFRRIRQYIAGIE